MRLGRAFGLLACGFALHAQTPELKPGLYAFFETDKGEFSAELYEKYTPKAVSVFIGLAQGVRPWYDPETKTMVKRRLYDGVTFHRVIREEMIQAGDPTGTGAHNCGTRLTDEFLPGLRFDRAGKLAIANTGEPNSGGCQFFITVGPVNRWDGKYTIFGQIISGQKVVDEINKGAVAGDKPLHPVTIQSVKIRRVAKLR